VYIVDFSLEVFHNPWSVSMPSLCAGMPLITMHYAPIFKRRETLKSVTHRAYGRMPCVYLRCELMLTARVSVLLEYLSSGS
jgi:hypothetical protein